MNKKEAKKAFGQAREVVNDIKRQIKEEPDAVKRKELRVIRKRLEEDLEVARKTWHDTIKQVESPKPVLKSPVVKKKRKPGRKAVKLPDPTDFRFVLRPKDFKKAIIDPTWKPKESQCKMLGKYVFSTLGDNLVRPQAIITIRLNNGNSDMEVLGILDDYFVQDAAQAYFGQVKVLSLQRTRKDEKTEHLDIMISTDKQRIKGFIRG